jgi:hypothetical protein
MGPIYEVRRWDLFTYYEIYSKLLIDRFSNSKVTEGDTQTQSGVSGFVPRQTDIGLGLILKARADN